MSSGSLSTLRRSLIFGVIFVIYFCAVSVAWGAIQRMWWIRTLWNVLATPLIHLVIWLTDGQSATAALLFYIGLVLNGLLWAAVLTYVITLFARTGPDDI